jgi:hypothetical protein
MRAVVVHRKVRAVALRPKILDRVARLIIPVEVLRRKIPVRAEVVLRRKIRVAAVRRKILDRGVVDRVAAVIRNHHLLHLRKSDNGNGE